MSSAPDRIAPVLGGFAARLTLKDVPPDVGLRARHLMLDAIGCALAARREDFATRFSASLFSLANSTSGLSGSGLSGVIGFKQGLPLRDAAFLNGILAHGLDYDDTHMDGIAHLSVSALPAALAVVAQREGSGADLLAAYIAALETGARLARVVKGGFTARGFHPTALVGTFSSALAAGKGMGLNTAQLVHAQGLALSMAGGSLQFLEDGSWTKRMHPGWAAQAGITAAHFAAHDIPAPAAPYEGRYGLYRTHLSDAQYEAADMTFATQGLSAQGQATQWELLNIAVKPFPMCHFVHASIDAAIALHAQGLHHDDIERVDVWVPQGVVQSVCEPVAQKRRPVSDYDAKFSLPYAVASGLLRGRLGLAELEPAAYQDPVVLALMDRIHYEVDPDSTFPRHYSGEVRVVLKDGHTMQRREAVNRGHPERQLTNEQVAHKFFQNAARHFSDAHAKAIHTAVVGLDQLQNVRELERLLAQDP